MAFCTWGSSLQQAARGAPSSSASRRSPHCRRGSSPSSSALGGTVRYASWTGGSVTAVVPASAIRRARGPPQRAVARRRGTFDPRRHTSADEFVRHDRRRGLRRQSRRRRSGAERQASADLPHPPRPVGGLHRRGEPRLPRRRTASPRAPRSTTATSNPARRAVSRSATSTPAASSTARRWPAS